MPTNARFERDCSVPPEALWPFLTDVDRLSTWFDPLIDYGGSRLDFSPHSALLFVAKDNHLLPALTGAVTRCDPPRVLEYTWGSETLRWQLAVTGRGCRLILTVTRFASVRVDASRWEACLDRLTTTLQVTRPRR